MFDSIVVIIGLVGGIASIVSFLIDKAGYGGKFVHAIYVFFVAVLASIFVYESSETKAKNQALTKEIQLITSIEYEAAQILKNSNRSNDGSKRGFIFASLAFLERNKGELPDSYKLAQKFAMASGVIENKQEDSTERLHQSWRLDDASDAMESLLKGLAAGRENEN